MKTSGGPMETAAFLGILGLGYIFQNKDIINNIKKECFEKYGVEHMMQLPHIAEKSSKFITLFP